VLFGRKRIFSRRRRLELRSRDDSELLVVASETVLEVRTDTTSGALSIIGMAAGRETATANEAATEAAKEGR